MCCVLFHIGYSNKKVLQPGFLRVEPAGVNSGPRPQGRFHRTLSLLNHLSSGIFPGHCAGVCRLAGPVCKLLFVCKPSEFY